MFRSILSAGVGVVCCAVGASAATVAQYNFDTLSGDPLVLADSSGSGLDITKLEPYGAITLQAGRPAVMPDGTFALNSNGGGAGSLVTASSDLFSVAKTGELTIEFWFNPQVSGLRYIAEFGNEAANGWDIYQTDGDGGVVINAGFRSNANAFAGMASSVVLPFNTWSHVAVTIAGDGAGKLYVGGAQVASYAYNPATFSTASSFFRLGAGINGTYANNAWFDELRISDVALLPGSGTGVGELAWDASLVPEPASLSVVGLAMVALARRVRRA